MIKRLHGLTDIHTVLSNQRKIGGAVEAKFIRLRSGEEYTNPVFISVDVSRGQYVSLGFITADDEHMLIHVDEIAMIRGLEYKWICELDNAHVKQLLTKEKINYLQKLCTVNQGFVTPLFKRELLNLVRDISMEEIEKQEITLPISIEDSRNLVYLNQRMFA